TQVAFFRTSDGGQHWQRSAVVPVTSERSAGVNVPLSVLSTNRWLLAVPNRPRLLDASAQAAPKTVESAAGTPANIVTLQMLNADIGWAKSASGNCVRAPRAAPRCAQTAQLLRTRSGGRDGQALALPPLPPAAQSAAGPAQVYSGQGFDSCYAATVDQMQTWFGSSPYRVWNLYLGGAMLYSGCTRLSAGFVSQLSQQGWQFILTWVGLQAYCTTFAYRMSSDPATAYNQGVSEANAALDAAANLGLTTADKSGVIIYFDMEAFSSSNSNCRSVAASFISGWSGQLRARGNKAGVYGLYTEMTDYVNVTNPPDDIWIAYWNNVPNLFGIPYIDDSLWANNQRLHQYGGGNETWGGVTLNIDSDVIGGDVVTPCYPLSVGASPTAAGYVQVYTTPNCSGPYFAFSSVLVKAVPNDGYLFTGWSGSATGTENPLTVTMDASKNLTANFLALRFRVFMPLYLIDPGSPGALLRPANKVTH
ncbi:MAG TPA: glycoside hydrolase domain-containing protein, partial [Chloroflexota bacterium]|nr:glycoside hydrolase domain-containing protein [Chloroflexota bacterium]